MTTVCSTTDGNEATSVITVSNVGGYCIKLIDWYIASKNGQRVIADSIDYIDVTWEGNLVELLLYELYITVVFQIDEAFDDPDNVWVLAFTVQRADCSDGGKTCFITFKSADRCVEEAVEGETTWICPEGVSCILSGDNNLPDFYHASNAPGEVWDGVEGVGSIVDGEAELTCGNDGDGFARFGVGMGDTDGDTITLESYQAYRDDGSKILIPGFFEFQDRHNKLIITGGDPPTQLFERTWRGVFAFDVAPATFYILMTVSDGIGEVTKRINITKAV